MFGQCVADQPEHGIEPVVLLQDGARIPATPASRRCSSKSRKTGSVLDEIADGAQFLLAHIAVGGRDDDHHIDERGMMADRRS